MGKLNDNIMKVVSLYFSELRKVKRQKMFDSIPPTLRVGLILIADISRGDKKHIRHAPKELTKIIFDCKGMLKLILLIDPGDLL